MEKRKHKKDFLDNLKPEEAEVLLSLEKVGEQDEPLEEEGF